MIKKYLTCAEIFGIVAFIFLLFIAAISGSMAIYSSVHNENQERKLRDLKIKNEMIEEQLRHSYLISKLYDIDTEINRQEKIKKLLERK